MEGADATRAAPHRVFLTLFRHSLRPDEAEHWDALWEDPSGPDLEREAQHRLES